MTTTKQLQKSRFLSHISCVNLWVPPRSLRWQKIKWSTVFYFKVCSFKWHNYHWIRLVTFDMLAVGSMHIYRIFHENQFCRKSSTKFRFSSFDVCRKIIYLLNFNQTKSFSLFFLCLHYLILFAEDLIFFITF